MVCKQDLIIPRRFSPKIQCNTWILGETLLWHGSWLNDLVTVCYTLTALVEEPAKMIVLKKSSDAASIQSSSSALHMTSTIQETTSSSMAQIKFQSMSATSMTSVTSETMVAMGSCSMMEMSSQAHVAGSSLRSISYQRKGENTSGNVPCLWKLLTPLDVFCFYCFSKSGNHCLKLEPPSE